MIEVSSDLPRWMLERLLPRLCVVKGQPTRHGAGGFGTSRLPMHLGDSGKTKHSRPKKIILPTISTVRLLAQFGAGLNRVMCFQSGCRFQFRISSLPNCAGR